MGRVIGLLLVLALAAPLVLGAFYPRDYCIPLANANICAIWNGSTYVWQNVTVNVSGLGGADGNNYPVSIDITGTNTKIVNLVRSGLVNINASFTDIDTNSGYIQWRMYMNSGIFTVTNNSGLKLNAGTGISITNDTLGNITITNTGVTSESDPIWVGAQPSYYNTSQGVLDNRSWNQTHASTLYAPISVTGDNASWNESYANGKYYRVSNGSLDNTSWNKTYADTLYYGIGNPSGYISSYTETDPFYNRSWNQTHASTLYAPISVTGDNTSWNQSGADLRYYPLNTNPLGYLNTTTGDGTGIIRLASPNASIVIWGNATDQNLTANVTYLDGFFVTGTEVPSFETDAAHDTCAEITNCVVGAITDGNTGWDNSYNFIANSTDASLRFVSVANNLSVFNLTVFDFLRAGSVNFTTLQITENTNLYFTDARAATAVVNTTILRNSTVHNVTKLYVNVSVEPVIQANATCTIIKGSTSTLVVC